MTQLPTPIAIKWAQIIGILGFGLAFFGANPVFADAATEAQQALNKAYNDYYTALRTGPAKTPEQQARLKSEIIGPAERALNRAMQQDSAAFDPNKAAHANSSTNGNSTRSNSRTATLGNQGGFRADNDAGGGTPAAPDTSNVDSAPIEGSAPRDIEFPGPSSPTPKATPPAPKTKSR